MSIKGTCKSVVELEYHLGEVFKATNDQLDWHNHEGRPYKLSMTNMPTGEHITRDQNVRDSMDMLPTWKFRKTSIQNTRLLLLQVSRSWNSLGKLTNLNVDERFTLNVALRMYTRRIVIQERVEDLQPAVESYQKKINLTKPDTYRTDLRKMTPYTVYRDIQIIIYQNDMDRNRLMRADELHKFSDGTLNHVRASLNDIAIGIQMEYLLKRKWIKQDKQRDRVMIKAIDKKLKYRRLMRSLEKFVGGRPYIGETNQQLQRPHISLSYDVLIIQVKSERFYTSAGNPVKEILLKLNLPDHRKLKDGGEDFRYSNTARLSRTDEVLKLKNFKKDATIKLFKSTNQERYKHVCPEVTSLQDGKVTRLRNEIMLGG
ncbi:hypothetical protein Tco_0782777 [Tanacetum coccineum]